MKASVHRYIDPTKFKSLNCLLVYSSKMKYSSIIKIMFMAYLGKFILKPDTDLERAKLGQYNSLGVKGKIAGRLKFPCIKPAILIWEYKRNN